MRDPTDPGGMLAWLNNTLATAEANNESVYILGHIPSGSSDCLDQWSARFRALIDRYSFVIRGQFFGHTHSDFYQLYKSYIDNSTIGMAFVAPSMTTNSERVPSFRVYEVDMETKIPIDYTEYWLNLTYYNDNLELDLEWYVAYSFLEEYGMPDMSFASYDNITERIMTDDQLFELLEYNYAPGVPEDLDRLGLYCSTNSVYNESMGCLGVGNLTGMGNVERFVISLLSGVWTNQTVGLF